MNTDMSQDLLKHFFSIDPKNVNKENDDKKDHNPMSFFEQLNSQPTNSAQAPLDDAHAEELKAINDEVLLHLKSLVLEIKFKNYFENSLELISLENQQAIFQVRTYFIKKSADQYKEEIQKALYNVLGALYSVEIQTKDPGSSQAPSFNFESLLKAPSAPAEAVKPIPSQAKFKLDLTPTREDLKSKVDAEYIEHMNPTKTGIRVDRTKTFENFIIGPTNNIAQAAARAVAQKPGKEGKYPSLYMHSNSGLGKTHLLHAVANEISDHYPHYRICLITARDFMDEMISLMQANRINEFVRKYTEKIDVLMIDDIHELKNKEGTQDQFFHVFNEMHNKGKQLIFTSDKRPKEIDGISERIKTRLQWGLVVDIQQPDLETRIAILRRKMEELDLFINEDLLTRIASKIKNNIRELEGSLVKLKAYVDVMNAELDLNLVDELLGLKSGESTKELTIESIAKATAQYYRLPLADLKSKARTKNIVKARHVAMYLSRKLTNITQEETGEYFGGKDHSSVIHAEKTIAKNVKSDASLAKDINTIETNL